MHTSMTRYKYNYIIMGIIVAIRKKFAASFYIILMVSAN